MLVVGPLRLHPRQCYVDLALVRAGGENAMTSAVELPIWLVAIMTLATAWAGLMTVFLPSVRWFLRRRVNRAIDSINTRLSIQIRPFQQTKRQTLLDRLTYDSEVLKATEAYAQETGTPNEAVLQRVHGYAREIVPAFNALFYYRFGYWLARGLSRFVYRIRVAAVDPDALAAVNPDSTVVFVMNHRSNMDYLLVTYLASREATLSYAVGEWARVVPLEQMVKALGGYFMRRNSNNPLYRKVLERYIHMSTKEGVCQAVYLEGGLSRDGHFAQPKLGFLDYMLRSFDAENDRDIVFVPIALNYDHVLEDMNMVVWNDPARQQGTGYHLRNFLRFLRHNLFAGRDGRFKRNGYASVNFGLPVSAAEFAEQKSWQFNTLDKEARFAEVGRLATELMEGIKHVMPILPVPLIASVFAAQPEAALRSAEIVAEIDSLIDRIIANGAAMKEDEKPRSATIAIGLQMLVDRGLLREEDDCYRTMPETVELIQYYANSIAHWLKDEA